MTFPRKLSSTKREELYDRWRGDAEFPTCNLCGLLIMPGQDWDESHEKHKPRWMGGAIEGLSHRRCNRSHNNRHDTPLYHKHRRTRQKHIGAHRSQSPLPGGRNDDIKKTMRGEVVDRATGGKPAWMRR